jgi:hypothetical protein
MMRSMNGLFMDFLREPLLGLFSISCLGAVILCWIFRIFSFLLVQKRNKKRPPKTVTPRFRIGITIKHCATVVKKSEALICVYFNTLVIARNEAISCTIRFPVFMGIASSSFLLLAMTY